MISNRMVVDSKGEVAVRNVVMATSRPYSAEHGETTLRHPLKSDETIFRLVYRRILSPWR